MKALLTISPNTKFRGFGPGKKEIDVTEGDIEEIRSSSEYRNKRVFLSVLDGVPVAEAVTEEPEQEPESEPEQEPILTPDVEVEPETEDTDTTPQESSSGMLFTMENDDESRSGE